ncbi:MAG: DUF4157 domain-containing protein [bacterium]|nr:DUF4157 domain-containing protein [bacterium]
MKTQLPSQKQSHAVIPAPAAKDPARKGSHARWQGAPFSTADFRQNRLPQIQAKMRVSQPHDPQEREADETAAKIMNMPEPAHSEQSADSASGGTSGPGADHANATAQSGASVQRQSASSSIIVARSAPAISEVQRSTDSQNSLISRESENEEREEAEETPQQDVARKVTSGAAETPPGESNNSGGDGGEGFPDAGSGSDAAGPDAGAGVDGSAGGASGGGDGTINLSGDGGSSGSGQGVDANVESRIRALRGRGQPLHANEKRFFESRFGRDFSRVRLHTDGQSQDLAKQVNAKAFAVGENIVFGRGYYQPGTRDGRELMAHELTHVVQQGKAPAIGATNSNPANAKQSAKQSAEAAKAGGAKADASHSNAAPQLAQQTHSPNPTAPGAPAISRSAAEGETVHRAPEEEPGFVAGKVRQYAKKITANIPGYNFLTFLLGRDPIAGKAIVRTPLNFIRALVSLIPGGNVVFQRIQQSKAVIPAFQWLQKEASKLGIGPALIAQLLKETLRRIGKLPFYKLAPPFVIGFGIKILLEVFGPTLRKIKAFAGRVATKVKEFIFRGFIRLVGGREGPIFNFLNPIVNLMGRIFNDPISFGRNLLGAVGKGFKQFMGNFVKHFKGALFGWMFGTFSKAGINVPTSFEPAAIFGFVAQLFAVTWTDIRAKIVKRMGPKGNTIMTAVEKSIEVVTILVTKGPGGLYEKIKQDLGSLKETILGAVMTWVRNTIIVKAIVKIASLLNPAGAIVQAILAIYNVVMFFIERFEQIKALVQGIMGALQNIVLGKIGPAANKVETTMARGLTLVISFLARLVGLGNIVKPVQKVIRTIKKRIDKAIDKIIRQITVRARVLWRKFKRKAKKAAGKILDWWRAKRKFKNKSGETHTIFLEGGQRNARLMIASKKGRYEAFVDRVFRNIPDIEATLKANAKAKSNSIDTKIKGMNRNKNATERQKAAEAIVTEINELAEITAKFPISGPEKPPTSNITYEPLKSDIRGTEMKASILSKLVTVGSRARSSAPVYEKIFRRKGKHFIRGHLLNNLLGGPGKEFNLAPTTISGNALHETQIETHVKSYLRAESQALSRTKWTPNDPRVMSYNVKAVYVNRRPSAVETKLKEESEDPGRKPGPQREAKKRWEIVRDERLLIPDRFEATWQKLKWDGRSKKWVPKDGEKSGKAEIKLPESRPNYRAGSKFFTL